MKVPPDLDQLMWLIAESGDDAAAGEFAKRFPELEIELTRRRSTVKGLRLARPDAAKTSASAPKFQPMNTLPPRRPVLRPVTVAAGLAGLAVFAWASYMAASALLRRPTPPTVPTEPGIHTGPPASQQPTDMRPVIPDTAQGKQDTTPPRIGDVEPVKSDPALKRFDIALEETPLLNALDAVAVQTGLELEIAPNMPNPTVSLMYTQMTGKEVLERMGEQYGFRAMNEGDNKYLIIPKMQWTDPQ